MLKSCFDCDSDVMITDVIHKEISSELILFGTGALIKFTVFEAIVVYTCRHCGVQWYVTADNRIKTQEIVNYEIW